MEAINYEIFAQRLKFARQKAGLTQSDLASMTNLSPTIISAYENPKSEQGKNPTLNNVFILSRELGVSIDWLCGLSDDSSTDRDKLSSTAFIRSIMLLIDNADDFAINDSETTKDSICFRFRVPINNFEPPLIGDLIKEYLEIKKVLQMDEIPQRIKDSLVEVLMNKYKDKSPLGLFGKQK
ncbi:MAG: helix-turn-helix domain-containing protein [Acutalibacteraceae bacterium]